MEAVKIVLELAVVLGGAIVMGTRSSGVALGLWGGGAGVAVLVFVFGEDVGSPPVDALLIVLSVVLASSMMQAAGGIDWMVTIAAKLIESRPKQITLIAPLVSFLFSVGAGTSNILYHCSPPSSTTSRTRTVCGRHDRCRCQLSRPVWRWRVVRCPRQWRQWSR